MSFDFTVENINTADDATALISTALRHPAVTYTTVQYRAKFLFTVLDRYDLIPVTNLNDDQVHNYIAEIITMVMHAEQFNHVSFQEARRIGHILSTQLLMLS